MDSSEPLIVEGLHMYEKDNAEAHHTYAYELVHEDPPTAVLRRGQSFNLTLRFNREWSEDNDVVKLLFKYGETPRSLRGTLGIVAITNRDEFSKDFNEWDVKFVRLVDNDLMIEVKSPADSPIGYWSLNVETITREDNTELRNTYEHESKFYLLFNPWIEEDVVHMEDKQLLDEYVLNDFGKIWLGAGRTERGRVWSFGQFRACVLPACMLMLEKSGIRDVARGDPIRMSRAISKIVNSNDDDGVLRGNWSGKYDGGIDPTSWTGSVPILEKFLATDGPVNFGQCWVYAGVTTTVCRALGIPSRVVTNFDSAHDYNASLTIDEFYDENNVQLGYDPTTGGREDMIWNFHVWNDVWMARHDLPLGYGGWQAIDATPQETSESFYQCGPASVEAIKQGVVGHNYDVTFMVAQVNADLIKWKIDPSNDFGYSKIYTDKYQIGRLLLTKAPFVFDPNGESDREDITDHYKSPEGTPEERLNLLRAVRSIQRARMYYKLPAAEEEDVKFELIDLDRINIGEPFTVIVNIENKSYEPRNVDLIMSVASVYYNGVKANEVANITEEYTIEPMGNAQVRTTLTIDDYFDKLVEYSIMKLHAIASVKETKQTWAAEDNFQVVKPSINVTIDADTIVVGQPSMIRHSFMNPLGITLTDCTINYASPGLENNTILSLGEVGPGEEILIEDEIWPKISGTQHIVATFTSNELTDIIGSASFEFFNE